MRPHHISESTLQVPFASRQHHLHCHPIIRGNMKILLNRGASLKMWISTFTLRQSSSQTLYLVGRGIRHHKVLDPSEHTKGEAAMSTQNVSLHDKQNICQGMQRMSILKKFVHLNLGFCTSAALALLIKGTVTVIMFLTLSHCQKKVL